MQKEAQPRATYISKVPFNYFHSHCPHLTTCLFIYRYIFFFQVVDLAHGNAVVACHLAAAPAARVQSRMLLISFRHTSVPTSWMVPCVHTSLGLSQCTLPPCHHRIPRPFPLSCSGICAWPLSDPTTTLILYTPALDFSFLLCENLC